MKMKAERVGFKIDGEWFTDHARGLVTDGNWRHAFHTIRCVEGLTVQQIAGILVGDLKLAGTVEIGEEGLQLVPEDRLEERDAYVSLVLW